MIIQAALEYAKNQISLCSESAGLDAQVLLAHILGKSRAWVMAHPEITLASDQEEMFQHSLARLRAGEPLPYLLGHWEFFGLDFTVNPAVLIPRPETEQLVEHALDWLVEHPNRRQAVDVGTGSGCIAVALASRVPDLHILGVDVSMPALRVAWENIHRYQMAERICLLQADLLTPILPHPNNRFDLIAANLPYIPERTLDSLDDLRFEPELALYGGVTGTELIERLLKQIPHVISPGGLLLLEIEATIGRKVQDTILELLPEVAVRVLPDYAGHDRLVVVET